MFVTHTHVLSLKNLKNKEIIIIIVILSLYENIRRRSLTESCYSGLKFIKAAKSILQKIRFSSPLLSLFPVLMRTLFLAFFFVSSILDSDGPRITGTPGKLNFSALTRIFFLNSHKKKN